MTDKAPTPLERALFERLDRQTMRLRMRRRIATMALLLAVGGFVLNVALHPITASSCELLTRRDLLEIGVLPAVLCAGTALLLHVERASAQLFVRGVAWSLLMFGALAPLGYPGLFPIALPGAGLASIVTLLALGDVGLEASAFARRAHPLTSPALFELQAVLLTADTLTQLVTNAANLFAHPLSSVLCAGFCAALGLSLVRFGRASVALTMALSITLLAIVAAGELGGFPAPIAAFLAISAAVQSLIGPAILSALEPTRSLAPPRRLVNGVRASALVGLALLGLVSLVRGPDPELQRSYCIEQAKNGAQRR